jgi:hypothetical protein
MDWAFPIDLYCERLVPGFWAEPLNAVSNAGFIVVALAALYLQRPRRDLYLLALSLLVLAIGIGSFLFHTFANGWSSLADVIPIAVFIYAYLALALHRFLGFGWPATMTMLVGFMVLNLFVDDVLPPLFGSANYVPALLAMLAIGPILLARRHAAAPYVLAAALVFLVSLTLRTLDLPLCDTLPLGLHFLWHLLNAATLGMLLYAGKSSSAASRK